MSGQGGAGTYHAAELHDHRLRESIGERLSQPRDPEFSPSGSHVYPVDAKNRWWCQKRSDGLTLDNVQEAVGCGLRPGFDSQGCFHAKEASYSLFPLR
jgi:hypothetical protein